MQIISCIYWLFIWVKKAKIINFFFKEKYIIIYQRKHFIVQNIEEKHAEGSWPFSGLLVYMYFNFNLLLTLRANQTKAQDYTSGYFPEYWYICISILIWYWRCVQIRRKYKIIHHTLAKLQYLIYFSSGY